MAKWMSITKTWIFTKMNPGFRAVVVKVLVILLIGSLAVNIILLNIGNRQRVDNVISIKKATVNKMLEKNSKEQDFVDFKVQIVDAKVKGGVKNVKPNVAIKGKEKQIINKNQKVEICREILPVTNHLIRPNIPSDMSNWEFKSDVHCPAYSIDKHPNKRYKIMLNCSGQKPKFVTTVAQSSTDIETVNFGKSCLAKVIDNCCKGKPPVPNVIHYIWYADKELGFFQFVSFMSALRFVRPCLFLIHGNYIPRGKYWDYFISIAPNVIHVKRDKPTAVFGHKLAFEEHASDIMRIEALKMYGGIYLDFDEIVLRPLEPLRKYEYTQGHERDVTLGSQLVMAKKNATFLNYWYNSYKIGYKAEWAWNALWVPEKLSRKFPKLIHVEGYNFTRPNWQHVDQIYKMNYDWSTNYGMHFYLRWYTNYTDIKVIRTLNTTIGAVCRHVLFGNKELCSA